MAIKTMLQKIRKHHHKDGLNCAQTSLKILAEKFGVNICPQVISSARGLNGAGRYRAQCGLVEGVLMFIALKAESEGKDRAYINEKCFDFAKSFEKHFGSLLCRDLRPAGFNKTDPPNVCEKLTLNSISRAIKYIASF